MSAPWQRWTLQADGPGLEYGIRVGDHVDPHESLDAAFATMLRDGGEIVARDAAQSETVHVDQIELDMTPWRAWLVKDTDVATAEQALRQWLETDDEHTTDEVASMRFVARPGLYRKVGCFPNACDGHHAWHIAHARQPGPGAFEGVLFEQAPSGGAA